MTEEWSNQIVMAERLAMVVQVLEQRSAVSIQEQQEVGPALQNTMASVRNDISQLIEGSGHRVAQVVKSGLDSALMQGTAKYEQVVNASTTKIDSAGHRIEKVLHETVGAVRHQLWLTFGAIAGAMLFLILGGGITLWMQWRSYTDARARTVAAQVDAETMEAFNAIGVRSCGGHPCIPIDSKSPRWGSKGEYVLINTTPKPKANNVD